MKTTTRVHPEATAEAREARRWYHHQDRPELAEQFAAAAKDALEAIELAPQRWAPYLYGARRFHLRRFPYALVYLSDEHGVFVVALTHHKRRPGYWALRVVQGSDPKQNRHD